MLILVPGSCSISSWWPSFGITEQVSSGAAFCPGWQFLGLLPLCPVGRVCVCLSVCDVPLGMVGSQVSPVSCFQFLCLNPSLSSHSLISRFNFLNTPCGLQPLAWIFKGRQPGPGAWSRLGTRELSGGAGAPAPPVIRSNPRAVQAPPPSPHRTLGSQEPAGLTEVEGPGLES